MYQRNGNSRLARLAVLSGPADAEQPEESRPGSLPQPAPSFSFDCLDLDSRQTSLPVDRDGSVLLAPRRDPAPAPAQAGEVEFTQSADQRPAADDRPGDLPAADREAIARADGLPSTIAQLDLGPPIAHAAGSTALSARRPSPPAARTGRGRAELDLAVPLTEPDRHRGVSTGPGGSRLANAAEAPAGPGRCHQDAPLVIAEPDPGCAPRRRRVNSAPPERPPQVERALAVARASDRWMATYRDEPPPADAAGGSAPALLAAAGARLVAGLRALHPAAIGGALAALPWLALAAGCTAAWARYSDLCYRLEVTAGAQSKTAARHLAAAIDGAAAGTAAGVRLAGTRSVALLRRTGPPLAAACRAVLAGAPRSLRRGRQAIAPMIEASTAAVAKAIAQARTVTSGNLRQRTRALAVGCRDALAGAGPSICTTLAAVMSRAAPALRSALWQDGRLSTAALAAACGALVLTALLWAPAPSAIATAGLYPIPERPHTATNTGPGRFAAPRLSGFAIPASASRRAAIRAVAQFRSAPAVTGFDDAAARLPASEGPPRPVLKPRAWLSGPPAPAGPDLVALSEIAGLGTFARAARAVGLDAVLRPDGAYTIFVPSDAAFAALGDDALAGLLQPSGQERLLTLLSHHVLDRRLTLSDLAGGAGTYGSLAGQPIAIDATNAIRIGDAALIEGDLEAANGVIHVIDKVLTVPAS